VRDSLPGTRVRLRQHVISAAHWQATVSSLSTRNYRYFFFGQIVSTSGTWMQTVAQSILVLQLTHSGTILGATIAARFAPMLVLGPWGGLVADRLSKRRILYVTQTLSGLIALAFGLLVGAHQITLWMIYVLALCLGFVNVFDNPARQALISELVPPGQLRNAVTLNSVTANMARVLGAAGGGGITAVLGLAMCFNLNAASFGAVLISLVAMGPGATRAPVRRPPWKGELRAGFRHVRSRPELLIPLIMVAVVGTLAWEFQVSLPLLATVTFHGGAGTYGLMTAFMGAGAIVGGLVSASRSTSRWNSLAIAAVGWGIAITVAALAPGLTIEYASLLFVGYGSITFNSLAKTTLQLAASPAMRGRVMALWALAWQGSTPVGGPIVGWVAQSAGPRWGLLIGGLPTIAIGLLAFRLLQPARRGELPREGMNY
jgi:MFS family permease